MAKANTLQLSLTQPQADFVQMPHKYRLFAAGYGSGKSEAMVAAALIDACQSATALVAIYEPTYDLVRLIAAQRLQQRLSEHGVQYNYNKAENVIYTASPGWGDFILRTMDNPARIVGYESFRAHCDEIDTLRFSHAQEAWNKVIARNRQSIGTLDNKVSAYTTPEGFNFAHWRWVTEGGDDYGMVQAPSYSNPYLPDGYLDSLRSTYPAELIDAYIEGRFVNLTSGTVYSSFDREHNACDTEIESGEMLYIGQDFNVGAMASVVYVKRDGEFHAADELVDLYDTPALIRTIQERYAGHRIAIYPDASGASRKTVAASKSDIALLEEAGFSVRAPRKNPPVKDRIVASNQAFESRAARVNPRRCPEFVRSLEQQAYDKNGEPDKESGMDHMNDAGTYPIAYEMPVRKPVAQINVGWAT